MAVTAKALAAQGVDPWLIEAFEDLVHSGDRDFDTWLTTVSKEVPIEDTKARCHCHFVARDGNDRPDVEGLAKWMSMQIANYCIPRSRLREAAEEYELTEASKGFLRLGREARELFSRAESSGEGGEMLLYLLLEIGLGLPQLLCKMPLKTNREVHYHGVDGIHGALGEDGKLGLYWCEAKVHADVAKATRECFKSLAPFLLDPGDGAAQRDLVLVRDNLDTGDPRLTAALQRYLTDTSVESRLREVRGACLIGFSLEEYPDPHEADGVSVVKEVAEAIEGWFERAGTSLRRHELEAFEIEVFCVPMPDVAEFRAALKRNLSLQ